MSECCVGKLQKLSNATPFLTSERYKGLRGFQKLFHHPTSFSDEAHWLPVYMQVCGLNGQTNLQSKICCSSCQNFPFYNCASRTWTWLYRQSGSGNKLRATFCWKMNMTFWGGDLYSQQRSSFFSFPATRRWAKKVNFGHCTDASLCTRPFSGQKALTHTKVIY